MEGRERKLVGRQWSVGTISADACSYAVRVLLSRAEIPAGFLRSLSSRAAFAERRRGQGCRKKERDEKKEGERERDWKEKRGRLRRERERAKPNQSSTWASHDIRSASGVMKSSSWRTSWLHFARIRRRRRASCNGKILYSAATENGASREARRSRYGL